MPTGSDAVCVETNLHAGLRRDFPDAVIPASEFADYLRVKSEVYAGWLEIEIQKRLDTLEDDLAGDLGDSDSTV